MPFSLLVLGLGPQVAAAETLRLTKVELASISTGSPERKARVLEMPDYRKSPAELAAASL